MPIFVPMPKSINPNSAKQFKGRQRTQQAPEALANGIANGDRLLLSRAITLVESNLPQHQQQAQEVIAACLPYSGNSIRVGITGVPGVGKSTFIEAFGLHLCQLGKKVAVLAIDPTSQRTKGSILGDKTRMQELSSHPNAYIRPSPAGSSLGGVARATRETMMLCEAAGFDTILVETVGVGQSETAVHSMVDFFLLLSLAGAGDELQGIKRGIMEMADAIAINKADGDNQPAAKRAQSQLKAALHLFPASESGWIPRTALCSALHNQGIDEIWQLIDEHHRLMVGKNLFEQHRQQQAHYWMLSTIRAQLQQAFFGNPSVAERLAQLEAEVAQNRTSPFAAANELVSLFKNSAQ